MFPEMLTTTLISTAIVMSMYLLSVSLGARLRARQATAVMIFFVLCFIMQFVVPFMPGFADSSLRHFLITHEIVQHVIFFTLYMGTLLAVVGIMTGQAQKERVKRDADAGTAWKSHLEQDKTANQELLAALDLTNLAELELAKGDAAAVTQACTYLNEAKALYESANATNHPVAVPFYQACQKAFSKSNNAEGLAEAQRKLAELNRPFHPQA